MYRFAPLITLVTGALLLPSTAHADSFFLGLGDLPDGSFLSRAQGVSGDGMTVVGYGRADTVYEAFRWTSVEGMTGLGHLPGSTSSSGARGISADGSTIVGYSSTGNTHEPFRWTASEGMVGLGFLPGGGNYGGMAWSASGDGSVIVGSSDTSTAFMQAFRWTQAGGMIALPDLPGGDEFSEALGVSANGSVAVGQGTSDAGIEACFWTTKGVFGLGSLPGGEYRSQARAASADGTVIVGGSQSELSGPDAWEMFRWTEQDGMLGLGDLPGGVFDSFAYDASVDSSVLVGFGGSQRGQEAAVWDAEHGLRSLYDILVADGVDLSGWSLTVATGVSDDGLTIVGSGTNPIGDTEAWLAHIPEPATLSLLTFGLAAALRSKPRR